MNAQTPLLPTLSLLGDPFCLPTPSLHAKAPKIAFKGILWLPPSSLSLLALCVGSINQGEVRVPRDLGTYHQQGGREADGRDMDSLASGLQRRCKNRIAGLVRQTESRDRPLLEKYWPAVSTHLSDGTSQALPLTL